MVTVAICRYGAGNVRSVELALGRLGAEFVDDVECADLAILPGVGSARSAMDGLRERGTDDVLRKRHEGGGPILGICLVLLTTAVCVYAAGRIFRVGILMQGKGANVGQVVKWVFRG